MAKSIKKKRMTRHELKEDKFLEATKNFITFFRANTARIILTIIILLGVSIAVRVYFSNRRNAEETARIKKLYADALFENGNFKDAVGGYQEIIQLHGGTRAGKISTLFLANCYYFVGDMDNALEFYEKALKLLKKNPNWASASEMGIASVYEQKGSFDAAIESYNNVISNYENSPARIDAFHSKARCLEFMNRYPEAIEVYSAIESEYPDTDFANEAKQRIVFLKGAVESERIPK
ncbi:tetratricopeptide repeat protein [candidate division WOR-3 bacterium]|nr:tetratricopeptide repeat protein [candidate division WOR-3 bacterium]MCK4575775.1 tetratricopeptide repeat protein [candidate division WOR-3 bacterium]